MEVYTVRPVGVGVGGGRVVLEQVMNGSRLERTPEVWTTGRQDEMELYCRNTPHSLYPSFRQFEKYVLTSICCCCNCFIWVPSVFHVSFFVYFCWCVG